MFPSSLVLLALASLALAAPALDSTTLLNNAYAAQSLNAQFAVLAHTDPCSTGQTACIAHARAQCVAGVWATTPCLATQQCLALPSVRDSGTFVSCTSEASALALLRAAGAQGVLASSASLPTTATTTTCTSSPTNNNTVTVTVTVDPVPTAFTTTLPAETTTLSPAEASSLLAGLAAAGAFTSFSPSAGAATTILLNPTSSPTNY